MSSAPAGLSIGEVTARTGVGENTLRMWEVRYGFPAPVRQANGRRSYSTADVERIQAIVRAREEGLSLPKAIDRVRRLDSAPPSSVFAALRDRFDQLQPQPLPKPALLWLTRAIEDESRARASRPVLLACFQRERFYRQSQARWRELARGAERAIVLAEFPAVRVPPDGPAEVPLGPDDAMLSEWVVVCESAELPACLVGWERPPGNGRGPRVFETMWTLEPAVVREAARACVELVARTAPELVGELRERLAAPAPAAGEGQVRAAVGLATRVAAYAWEAQSGERVAEAG